MSDKAPVAPVAKKAVKVIAADVTPLAIAPAPKPVEVVKPGAPRTEALVSGGTITRF